MEPAGGLRRGGPDLSVFAAQPFVLASAPGSRGEGATLDLIISDNLGQSLIERSCIGSLRWRQKRPYGTHRLKH